MSTRAVIKIIEKVDFRKQPYVVNLYHHWDGYPEYLGRVLMGRLMDKVGTIYVLKNEFTESEEVANVLIKDKQDDGFEFTNYFHSDVEYLYTVDIAQRTLTCQRVRCKNWNVSRYTVIETIDLTEYVEKDIIGMAN